MIRRRFGQRLARGWGRCLNTREPLEQPEGHVNPVETTALTLGLVMSEDLLPCRRQWFERSRSTAQHCLREACTTASQALIKAQGRSATEIGMGIGLHFAQEQLLSAFGADHLRREHLQGHDAIHGLVDGLVDPSHAPLADLIENLVRANEESAVTPHHQHLGLKPRQQFPRHQRLGHVARVGDVPHFVDDDAKLLIRQQFADAQVL